MLVVLPNILLLFSMEDEMMNYVSKWFGRISKIKIDGYIVYRTLNIWSGSSVRSCITRLNGESVWRMR